MVVGETIRIPFRVNRKNIIHIIVSADRKRNRLSRKINPVQSKAYGWRYLIINDDTKIVWPVIMGRIRVAVIDSINLLERSRPCITNPSGKFAPGFLNHQFNSITKSGTRQYFAFEIFIQKQIRMIPEINSIV